MHDRIDDVNRRTGTSRTLGGFLSLGIEKSHRTLAKASISCHGSCICNGEQYSAHTPKRYTYLQRTVPRWLYWPSLPSAGRVAQGRKKSESGDEEVCMVELLVAEIANGSRLFVKALTFSPPRVGNKSVSVGSLYSLP